MNPTTPVAVTAHADKQPRDQAHQPAEHPDAVEGAPEPRPVIDRAGDTPATAHQAGDSQTQVAPSAPVATHDRQPTAGRLLGARSARQAALVEDAEWIATTGETMPGAAARFRMKPCSLRQALTDAGRADLWARLVANADPDYPITGSIRSTRRAA